MKDSDHVDEVVDKVVTITELPSGFGQEPQKLPEPIEILKFKEVEFDESLHRPEKRPAPCMLTAEEVEALIKSPRFIAGMIPKKIKQCQSCSDVLPDDRGRHCHKCKPILQDDPGDFTYCGVSGE
jgi:hypothetical protein